MPVTTKHSHPTNPSSKYSQDEEDDYYGTPRSNSNVNFNNEDDFSSETDEEDAVYCPLCVEKFDATDKEFKPCRCGYQICCWCWHKLMEEGGRCPNCRSNYDQKNFEFKMPDAKKIQRDLSKKLQKKEKKTSRKHLANVRVIQRNLVYTVGLTLNVAKEDYLKRDDNFGKYGKITKIVVNKSNLHNTTKVVEEEDRVPTVSAYITYSKPEEARRAIQAMDGTWLDGKLVRASFGTTKYCAYFLRGIACNNPDCMYLHEYGNEEDTFNKEDIILKNGLPVPNNADKLNHLYPPGAAEVQKHVWHFNPESTTESAVTGKDLQKDPLTPLSTTPLPISTPTSSKGLPSSAKWGSVSNSASMFADTKSDLLSSQNLYADSNNIWDQTDNLWEIKHSQNSQNDDVKSRSSSTTSELENTLSISAGGPGTSMTIITTKDKKKEKKDKKKKDIKKNKTKNTKEEKKEEEKLAEETSEENPITIAPIHTQFSNQIPVTLLPSSNGSVNSSSSTVMVNNSGPSVQSSGNTNTNGFMGSASMTPVSAPAAFANPAWEERKLETTMGGLSIHDAKAQYMQQQQSMAMRAAFASWEDPVINNSNKGRFYEQDSITGMPFMHYGMQPQQHLSSPISAPVMSKNASTSKFGVPLEQQNPSFTSMNSNNTNANSNTNNYFVSANAAPNPLASNTAYYSQQQSFRALLPNVNINFTPEFYNSHPHPFFNSSNSFAPNVQNNVPNLWNTNNNVNINNININISNQMNHYNSSGNNTPMQSFSSWSNSNGSLSDMENTTPASSNNILNSLFGAK